VDLKRLMKWVTLEKGSLFEKYNVDHKSDNEDDENIMNSRDLESRCSTKGKKNVEFEN
jgi:hypothetical protein